MPKLYLLAILPPDGLAVQIDEIRQECSERYGVKAALKPPIHITLLRPFFMDDNMQAHLNKWLLPVTHLHAPTKIELENFDAFNIHTIFIRAFKTKELGALQKDVAAVMNKNKIDPKEVKGNTLFTPHVTIAYRDIPPEVFPHMWDEYKNKKFKRDFIADSFTLLKHNGKKWEFFKDYQLDKPEITTLF